MKRKLPSTILLSPKFHHQITRKLINIVIKFRFPVVIILLLSRIYCQSAFSAPKIILKLDDFQALNNTNNCKDVMDFLLQRQVKASFGAIAKNFDNTSLTTLAPYLNATYSPNQKLFEIWNHSYDHTSYLNTPYTNQKSNFDLATQTIKQYLGVQMHTFGSPGNGSDTITNRVISGDPNYKVFMFASVIPTIPNGIMYLSNRVNIETSTGNPDSAYLATNYFASRNNFTDYMVLQAHPPVFTAAGLLEFKKCIDFLIKQGCVFTTPYEYYLYVNFAPSNLKLSVISDTKIILDWQDKTTNEINYLVECSSDGKVWTSIVTLPANTTSYTDQTVLSATTKQVYYRVCAKTSTDYCYSDMVRNNVGLKYFVDPVSGIDTNDGLSWSKAVKTIDKATALAAQTSGTDDIYIKGGTTVDFSTSTWITAPENYYGGFQGTETSPSDRPLIDLDGNGRIEPWEFKYPTTILSSCTSTALQISAPVFNGFSISHTASKTGVLTAVNCNVNGVFENNVIRNSTLVATASGGVTLGGILIRAAGVVKNCLFEKNQVTVVINQTNDKPFTPIMDVALGTKVTGCVFRNNKAIVDCTASTAGPVAYARGMIVNTFGGAAGSASAVSNCLIYNNEATYTGGGGTSTATMPYAAIVACSGYSTGTSTDSIMNCTITNNKTTSMVCAGFLAQTSGTLLHYAFNNVFWNNQNVDAAGNASIKNMNIGASVTTGCIGYNVANGGQVGGYAVNGITTNNYFDLSSTNSALTKTPNFTLPTTIVGTTTNGSVELADWRPAAGSYLIGKGFTTTNLKDIAGTSFGTIRTVGAYEYDSSTGINEVTAIQSPVVSTISNGLVSSKDGYLEIMSMQGKLLKHEFVHAGQIIKCSSGVFICRLTANDGLYIQKIIIR